MRGFGMRAPGGGVEPLPNTPARSMETSLARTARQSSCWGCRRVCLGCRRACHGRCCWLVRWPVHAVVRAGASMACGTKI